MKAVSRKHELTCVLSNAGEEVCRAYGVTEDIEGLSSKVYSEKTQGYSTPISGSSLFEAAVIAPATSNTCAKIVRGIGDSAVTNIAAQFMKRGIQVIIMPTDIESEVETELPSGKKVIISCRPVDLENTSRLKRIPCVTVVESPRLLASLLDDA